MYNPFLFYVMLQSCPPLSCHVLSPPYFPIPVPPSPSSLWSITWCSTAQQHFALIRHMLSNGLYPFCIHDAISWNNLCVPSPLVWVQCLWATSGQDGFLHLTARAIWSGWLMPAGSGGFVSRAGEGDVFWKAHAGMIWIYKGPWGCFRDPMQCESDDALSLRALLMLVTMWLSSHAHSSEHKSLYFAYCASIQKIKLTLYCRYVCQFVL